MTTSRPLHPTPADPGRRAVEPAETVNDDPLDRYKAALRDRFPGSEEIFRRDEQRRLARRSAAKAGATTAAVAALAAGLWIADPAYRSDSFTTAVGETGTRALADGSTVTLNTGSTLQVQWRLRSRRLRLERGEAMFRVAHGARDFIVHAKGTTIRDIGTSFNVRLEETQENQSVTVTVLEGAVEVRAGADRAVLTTGQTAAAGPAGLETPRATDPAPLTAWQRGKLVFDGMPLDRAVAEMRRYHAAPIVLDLPDARASVLRLSGEFDHRRIDALLDLLPAILPVRVRRLPDGRVVISAAATAVHRPAS